MFLEVHCDNPKTPENGYIQGAGPYKAGDVVQFHCNPDFMMEGQPIIACQENSRWSGKLPKCNYYFRFINMRNFSNQNYSFFIWSCNYVTYIKLIFSRCLFSGFSRH